MSEEQNEERDYVEVYGEDGNIIKFEIYDIIDFEGKTYALLTPYGEEDDDTEVVVMEYVEKDDDNAYFRDIEDEAVLEKLYSYIQNDDEFDDEEDM